MSGIAVAEEIAETFAVPARYETKHKCVCVCVLKLRRVAKHKMENSVEKIISKSKSKYYRLGCRTLPSIIVIDKIVIVL